MPDGMILFTTYRVNWGRQMKLSDKITIKIDNEDYELFMSFGLLHKLASLVETPEMVPQMLVVGDLREKVLRVLLTKRDRSGKVIGDPVENIDDVLISRKDAEKVLTWAMEHVLDFFVESLRKIREMSERRGKDLEDLLLSESGSSGSPSKS